MSSFKEVVLRPDGPGSTLPDKTRVVAGDCEGRRQSRVRRQGPAGASARVGPYVYATNSYVNFPVSAHRCCLCVRRSVAEEPPVVITQLYEFRKLETDQLGEIP